MFLKLLVCLFSIIVLVKNFSYAMYEYRINENSVGAACVCVFSFVSVVWLNAVLFFIRF